MSKYVLGINYGSGHNSSAALLFNNKIVAAIEEERISRIKNDNSFPNKSIDFCLNKAKIQKEDIEYIGIGWDPYCNLFRKLIFLLKTLNLRLFFRKIYFLVLSNMKLITLKKKIRKRFKNSKILFFNHHLCHGASSYYFSKFNHSHILTFDGRGDWSTSMIAYAKNGSIKIKKEQFWPNSIGMIYTAFTHYLGFDFDDEYKVMGLAPYGKPKYENEISKIVTFDKKSIFKINKGYFQHPSISMNVKFGEAKYFSQKIVSIFGKSRKKNETIEQRHKDIAASLQVVLNKLAAEIVRYTIKNSETKNLCLSGGVALNGVMNHYIYENTEIENLFIQPASSDAGIALGVCALLNQKFLKSNKINFSNVYFGNEYSNKEILKQIRNKNLKSFYLEDPSKFAAELISKGYIIGWFQGRSEFGPRALGNRSIVADPRPKNNKYLVNSKIKFREEFRPFAPSVLSENFHDWFESNQITKFMIQIVKVKKSKRNIIQAVTHVDFSARPQAVNKIDNPRYHRLIFEFNKITGCPVVLNTSFNVKGEPIVDSPLDAINCFFNTELDFLIVGNYLISNKFINISQDLDINKIIKT